MKFKVSWHSYNIVDTIVEASSEEEAEKIAAGREVVRLENPSIADYEKSFIYNGDFTFLGNAIADVKPYTGEYE